MVSRQSSSRAAAARHENTSDSVRRAEALIRIDVALTAIGKIARSRRAAELRQRRAGVALPDTTVAALAAVYRHGPLRIGEVAAHMDVDASRASREIRRLVEVGFVSQRTDPRERRASELTITPAGRAAFERYRAAADDIIARVFAGWSDTDLDAAAAVVQRLADSFDGGSTPPPS